MRQSWILGFALATLFACGNQEKEIVELKFTIDSLKRETTANQHAMEMLHQIATLMDSIDDSRFAIRTHLEEGTPLQEYVLRMKDINNYINKSRERIAHLEKEINARHSARVHLDGLAGTIKKLKSNLSMREHQWTELQKEFHTYRRDKGNLVQLVDLQGRELEKKSKQLEVKKLRLLQLEKQNKEIQRQTRRIEANGYFAQAQAIEQAAERTRFAPRKKKQTQLLALELYRRAAQFGLPEARARAKELEKKI